MKTIWTILFFLTSVVSLVAADASYPPVPKAPVVAHRGFSSLKPENTLAAFQAAVDVGANGAECDIRISSDGVIYLMHDGNFQRTGGENIEAGTIPYSQIATFNAGEGEKFPTLEEYLTLLKGTNTRPVIEVKENGFEAQLVETIRKMELEKTAVVIDFSSDRVKKVRELAPEICVAWLCAFDAKKTPESEIADRIISTLKDSGSNVVDVQAGCLTQSLVKRLHDAGITVWCWTIDDADTIEKLYKMGVDSITTNHPERALEIYNSLK